MNDLEILAEYHRTATPMHSGSLFSPTREWSTRRAAGCSAPPTPKMPRRRLF